MGKKYFAKIIAKDPNGIQVISACCSEANVKMNEIKYLKKNKLFLILLNRQQKEKYTKKKVRSICKFDFIESVKSKNIDQNNANKLLKLVTINAFKVEENFEIKLLFENNAIITLFSEVLEVTLEDQNNLDDKNYRL
tara:strand:+ start:1525 stop:1935 length:411 start_codon:yes stop_codon:yes gene_type:complete